MNQLIDKQPKRLPLKSAHPYHMYDMIQETPKGIDRILKEELPLIKEVAKQLAGKKNILLVGIGTSYHATLNAKYLLRNVGHIHAEAFNSFEFIQDFPLDLYESSSTAIVIFSHRGVKKYSHAAYTKSRELGLYTVLLTGTETVIEEKLDAIIRTSIPEQSSAFTISHTASAFVSLLLSNEIAKIKSPSTVIPDEKVTEISSILQSIFDKKQDDIKKYCKFVVDSGVTHLYYLGYGVNESNCYEVALKINEATWDYTTGYQVEQYLHGPFVATGPSTLSTFLIGGTDVKYQPSIERSNSVLKAVIAVNGKAAAIIPESDTLTPTNIGPDGVIIKLPTVLEPLSLFTNLYTLQLITYWLALERKTNPDSFRREQPFHDKAFVNSGILL
ncbi:hypothetical protein DLAC_05815 [Tieghemostelium lacteum]|uniref:SIS domain-containing protein n=1 Tax=Tieghemostelium lacteum TaxID=361077 RepID=A0A151ZGZ8_TIELA|nr:hypothetical protein DLAC_05815 [Tieghemostelium lacteum]|eukprot:KYQ93179.1 hypothetical protein DLAC_05815 [Tieghemostelium lacteum]